MRRKLLVVAAIFVVVLRLMFSLAPPRVLLMARFQVTVPCGKEIRRVSSMSLNPRMELSTVVGDVAEREAVNP
jgi:hypothetical protein